ncbi:putative aTP-dependent RNA helicase, partial [Clostridioides difficile CD196]
MDLKEQSIIASNENSYVTFKCRDILQLLVTWLFSLFKNLEDLGELYKNRY